MTQRAWAMVRFTPEAAWVARERLFTEVSDTRRDSYFPRGSVWVGGRKSTQLGA